MLKMNADNRATMIADSTHYQEAFLLVFGFSLYGDEYINLGVRHVNTFLWLLIAISGSLLLRVKPEQFRQGFLLYSATFLVMLMIIACRITFVPDKLMVFLFPPILLLVVVWQLCCCIWLSGNATSIDGNAGGNKIVCIFLNTQSILQNARAF